MDTRTGQSPGTREGKEASRRGGTPRLGLGSHGGVEGRERPLA
jgi:hypothetical protein